MIRGSSRSKSSSVRNKTNPKKARQKKRKGDGGDGQKATKRNAPHAEREREREKQRQGRRNLHSPILTPQTENERSIHTNRKTEQLKHNTTTTPPQPETPSSSSTMKYNEYYDHQFRRDVGKALKSVERILHVDRNPHLADEVDHEYDNKYEMADLLTNTTIISFTNVLERLGLTTEILKAIDASKTTTLRFEASDSAEFLSEQLVEIPSNTTFQTKETTKTSGSMFAATEKTTVHNVVKKVKEYHWRVTVSWEIYLYSGNDATGTKTSLKSRKSTIMIVTQTKDPSLSPRTDHSPIDISLNWLLKMIDTNLLAAQFKVDRQSKDTKTPRRNTQIEDAFAFFDELCDWCHKVSTHFEHRVEKFITMHNPAKEQPRNINMLRSIDVSTIFCPILPLMEETGSVADGSDPSGAEQQSMLSMKPATSTTSSTDAAAAATTDDGMEVDNSSGASKQSPMLSSVDMQKLINEQIRTITEAIAKLTSQFPAKTLDRLVSTSEATVVLLCHHVDLLKQQYVHGMGFIEEMLKNQLVAAIGKTVESHDLDQFMSYHNAKLLSRPPQAFCHAIQRPEHSPEGQLSIEAPDSDGKMESIETLCRQVETDSVLEIPLNAATTLELNGDMNLHGWVKHRFADTKKSYDLIARARQFSSFILIVGNMAGPTKLNPKDAIIVQNKDELIIPLLLDELPTAKEFKDAIKSLSPEQQRFAKAFRSMQLESSVFGVCIVEIKPQLEKLLGLPTDALAKEMQMMQDLMKLFIEYQVPSDLLSFDGLPTADVRSKVGNVKAHVKAVMAVIEAEKKKQLDEERKKAEMELEMQKARTPMAFGAAAAAPPTLAAQQGAFGGRGGMKMRKKGGARMAAPRMMKMSAPVMLSYQAAMPEVAMDAMNLAMEPSAAPPPLFAETGVQQQITSLDQTQQMATDANASVDVSADAREGTGETGGSEPSSTQIDFTLIPKMLDDSMEKYDPDNALRSTIIKTSASWTRKRKANLLTKAESSVLTSSEIKTEKDKAFDLLDALSRSGSLSIDCSSLHVLVCVTHCFENDVMGTVIQDNVNPIEKMERSTLLIGSAIHGVPAHNLVTDAGGNLNRLQSSFPLLLSDGVTRT